VPRTRAAIRLEPRPSGDTLVGAASWVGGVPRVPRDFRWPHRADRPLTFLAQINLADLSPESTAGLLPRRGVLLFFLGDAQGSAGDIDNAHFFGRVLFLDANDCNDLQSQYPPRSSAAEFLTEARAQSFVSFVDIPFAIEIDRAAAAELPSHAEAVYSDIREYLGQGGRPVAHGLLGHERLFSVTLFDRALAAARKSIANRPNGPESDEACKQLVDEYLQKWCVLAWFSSESATGYADGPRLTYWIREEDLRERRFDRVVVES
jgi:hypothetical protein